jgi:putative heme-binding domain-containing protein
LESPAEGAELEQRIDRYQKALAGPRNPQRGKQIFATFCLACHKLKEEGFEVGPPLGSVTNKPDEAILRDILDPSTHIESEFESYIVVTSQGRTFTGVLVSESATSVTLAMEKGMSESILRSDIDQMKASDVSLMPSNLHQQIGPQDAADLIAFLRGAFGSADSGNRDGQK